MDPMIKVSGESIKFFKDDSDTNPCIQLKLQSSGTSESATRSLQLPNDLPSETKALTVSSTGMMGYDDLGESAVTGTYEQKSDGALGIASGTDTLSTATQKIDTWIFRNLVDAPPAITELYFASNTTTSASVEWTKPTIYHLGLIDRTVPFITGLSVKIYKNDAAAADVTGGSGTVSVTAGSTDVTGSSTTFKSTAVAVGDSVTVTSGNLTGTASTSGTDLTGTGTAFSTELAVNQNITIGGQTRRVTAIASNTAATVSPAFASNVSGQTFKKSETRVVTAVGSDTSLTVDTAFAGAVSADTATFVSYSSSASETQDSLTTTVNHLPREDATTVVEAVTLIMDGGSTGQSGTVNSKHNYNIASSSFANTDLLKFEIYYTNHNDNLSNNVAYLADVEFKQPGAPGAPSNLSQSSQSATSMGISWTAPADNDVSEAGNQTTPAIEQYQLKHSSSALASGVVRFGGAQAHAEQTAQTGNTNTSATLSTLKPGQTYSVTVAAKNTINSNYGATDSASLDTALPTRPTRFADMTALSSRRSVDNYSANGRTLGVHTSISKNLLLKKSDIPNGSTTDYTTFSNLAVNESNANLESDRHEYQVDFDGSANISGMTKFRAFASTFPHAGAGNTVTGTSSHTKLVLSGHEDAYSGSSTGFWAHKDLQLKLTNDSLVARESPYVITLRKLEDSSSLHAKTDTFRVDDLANTAAVTALTFVSFPSDTNATTISGVATRGNGFQIKFHADIQHLGRYFVRFDKFADLKLQDGSNTFASTTLDPSSHTSFTYSDSTAASSPLDTAKSVRFEDLTLTYTDPGSGIHTQTSNSNSLVEVHVLPYNISGQGAAYERNGIDTTTNALDSSKPKIYLDTVSTRYLVANYDKSSGTGVHYPERRRLTQGGDTPTVSQSSHQVAFDNTQSLSSSYTDEMQFVNGRFRTKQDSNAYLNYGSLFLDHPSLTAMPDYSGISGSGYRYATLLYDLSSGSASTISYVDIKLKNYSLGSQTDGVISDFKLFVKLLDATTSQSDSFTPSTSNSSSIWLDANSLLVTAISRSQTNYSNSSLEPLAALEAPGVGNTTSDTKRISLVPGTPTSNLTILVRFGLDMSKNHSLGHIELECAAS